MDPSARQDSHRTSAAALNGSHKSSSVNGAQRQNGSSVPADASSGSHVPYIPLSIDSSNIEATALDIVYKLRPTWRPPCSSNGDKNPKQDRGGDHHHIHFVRFTEGITNTLIKAVHRPPGLPKDEADREAVLLRAYGHGTDVIIDRQRETQNHELLMRHGLAPELLARFRNGMAYRFIPGAVAQPGDLRRPDLSAAIARRLAQWHATVPCLAGRTHVGAAVRQAAAAAGDADIEARIDGVAPGKRAPNLWTVMQKWILALPTGTDAQRAKQATLQAELERTVGELSQRPGLGDDGLVFAHTDLLCGNVIILPPPPHSDSSPSAPAAAAKPAAPSVTFIDYEYAVPSPAAFDIANHFAEWGGLDCDMSVLPTVAQRRAFVAEYVRAYSAAASSAQRQQQPNSSNGSAADADADADETARVLAAEVDLYRGIPGFYWGIWALIQATISEIDFDYASYAEQRLGEYWDWRAEEDGSRAAAGREMPLRERRWAQLE